MSEYVSKSEFNMTTRMIEGDIKKLGDSVNSDISKLSKTVEKVVDKVDNLNVKVEGHDVTIEKLDKTVDKLDGTLNNLNETLRRVDIQTEKNTQSIQWNWKSITAAGFVLTLLLSALSTIITNAIS